MKRFAFAVAMAATTPALGMDIQTNVIDAGLMNEIYMSERDAAVGYVADFTVLGKIGNIDAAVAEELPVAADLIMYFEPGGRLLAWSDKSGTVVGGTWDVTREGSFNTVCIHFGDGGALSVCSSPELKNSGWLKESTAGNPFGLAAGQPVPTEIGKPRIDGDVLHLGEIAARFP